MKAHSDNADRDAANRRSFASKKFDWLECLAADERISPRAFEIGFVILQHINSRTGDAILSDDLIVSKTGLGRTRTVEARKDLKAAGWIDWTRTGLANIYRANFNMIDLAELRSTVEARRGAGQAVDDIQNCKTDIHASEQYDLHVHEQHDGVDVQNSEADLHAHEHHDVQKLEDDVHAREHKPLLNPLTTTPQKNTLKRICARDDDGFPASEDREADVGFASFWSQYPKRVGRQESQKAYRRVISLKQATEAELIAGAMRYAAERDGEDHTFTLNPTTWLNGKRWLDEPAPPRRLTGAEAAIAGVMSYFDDVKRGAA